jgi:uncharacterized protein YlxW (UPF0749 family)
MKKLSRILLVSLIVVFIGCQQSQQEQTSEISRKDKLIANENLNLRNELVQCQREIETQKNLVEQCRREMEEADQRANESIKWLMDE